MSTVGKTYDEFATVEAVLASGASTKNTDALILMWVKMEKQMRKVFSFLVYQNSAFDRKDASALIDAFVANRWLGYDSFVRGFDSCYRIPLSQVIGVRYHPLFGHLARIQKYRNKILHGQHTGLKLSSSDLKKDIYLLREWMTLVADACRQEVGYDGLERNALRKSTKSVLPSKRPIRNIAELRKLLEEIDSRSVSPHKRKRQRGRSSKP